MRRVLPMAVAAAVLVTAGCGSRSYEVRLDKTLEARRYNKRLNDNLAAAVKGKLEQNQIYLRPPLGLAEPTKDFTLIPLEPGKFDIAESFIEKDKQNLYVLARIKRPKTPPKPGAAPQPE